MIKSLFKILIDLIPCIQEINNVINLFSPIGIVIVSMGLPIGAISIVGFIIKKIKTKINL